MGRAVLVTGGTGAVGPHLLAELLRDRENERLFALVRPAPDWADRFEELRMVADRLTEWNVSPPARGSRRLLPIVADIRRHGMSLSPRDLGRLLDVNVIIHAAANTRLTAAIDQLEQVNVEGTRNVLALALRCPRLRQFLLVSTTCVSGTRTGPIAEQLSEGPGEFVNAYERTKWAAEQLVSRAELPVRIARLSTCLGAERTGYVHRFGALHQAIRWLARGLVPMMPCVDDSRVDLIPTDMAARWLARAAARPVERFEVAHVAAGSRAASLRELVAAAVSHLRARAPGWMSGQFEAPLLVDRGTFELLEQLVRQSRDALFRHVLQGAAAFFPVLLFPRTYQTAVAEELWGSPLPLGDWRSTLGAVIDFGSACNWRRPAALKAGSHA
jgi:thioester reductase-like protein